MLIHQLELQNFKSYNGRHVLGPFDPHFTCVIGPNGNGKSNIIDAVLFVFGFKSAKLRQDTLASLIHKSAFARPDHASVTVVFREGGVFTSVTRSVLKSGHSSYRVNGEKVGWGQLRERLMSKCIDLNKNLFIILQGEVERLCQLSPQKMVQYLEYVSGSDQFKESIDEAQRKYIQRSIVKEELRGSLGVRKQLFESIRQRAVQQTTWMLMKLKGMLLQHLVMKKMVLEGNREYAQLKEAEEEQVAACLKVEKELRLKEEEILAKRKELKQVLEEYRKGEQYVQQMEGKKEKAGLRVKDSTRQISFAIKDRQSKQQERSRLAAEIEQLAQIQQQRDQLQAKIKQLTKSLKHSTEMGKLKLCVQLQQKLRNAKKEEGMLAAKCSQDSRNLLADRQKLAIYEQKYKQNKTIIVNCRTSIKSAEEELKDIANTLTENEQLLQQIERQLSEKPNEKLASNQEKILNEIRSANKLKVLCRDTTLVTLRQLLIIDAAYADVVETVLPHLDYFIVDNVTQARELLEYLKQRKLGRMTVLIRESIREATKDLRLPTSVPKDTKLLYDVCKCTDQDTKGILMWSLGSTLVTSKLETAMKVAYYDEKRYRVITTNGEFIDSSGTMTKLPLKNGRQREDQEFLQKKHATVKRIITSLKEKRAETLGKKEDAERTLLSVENEERSLDGLDEVFLKELQEQLKENTAQLGKVRQECANLAQSMAKLQARLKESGFSMSKYDESVLVVSELMQCQEKVKKISNCAELINSLSAKIAEADANIAKMSAAIEQKVRAKSALQTDKMRLAEIVDTKRKELAVVQYGINQIQSEIKQLQAERKTLEDHLADGRRGSGLHQPREQLKRIRGRIRAVQAERAELLGKLQQSIQEIREFTFIISKTLSNCTQLIPKSENQQHMKTQKQQIVQQLSAGLFLHQTALVLGKKEYKFTLFLNQKQTKFLLQGIRIKGNLYSQLGDVRPSDPDADLLFESIPGKDVKFGHSYQVQKLKHFQKEVCKGEFDVDFQLFEEYLEKKRELEAQATRLSQASAEVQALKGQLIDLRNKRLDIFLKCFNQINFELNNIYMRLTGGKAELAMLDSMNPFEGVEFSVRPVNKSWKRVNLLSGGEKTFTSLALIFACEQIKKFPFYFMDQIDAALDYRNTSLLAQYITSKRNTQHIVISLRKNMYQECNRLVGVYKVKDQSRTVEMPMDALRQKQQVQG